MVCGIQVFFRGTAGIERLEKLLQPREPMQNEIFAVVPAVSLDNRLQELKRQRGDLEDKQGIFFRDENLAMAIAAIDAEVKKTES
jgi:hypothetical protein